MKKTFFSMPNALLLHALTTFLIGIGCTYPLSLSLGLTAPLSLSVGCCALVTLAFALLSCLRWHIRCCLPSSARSFSAFADR